MWRRASRTLGRVSGSVGENRERLIDFIAVQDIELEFKETIAPALGMSSGGRIAVLPGQGAAEEFSTLVHELAHEMLHKAERRTATTKIVREAEAEAIAFVVGSSIGLDVGHALPDYIHLYHGNAALLAESLEVIQRTSALILSSIEPPAADAAPVMAEAIAATFPLSPRKGRRFRPSPPFAQPRSQPRPRRAFKCKTAAHSSTLPSTSPRVHHQPPPNLRGEQAAGACRCSVRPRRPVPKPAAKPVSPARSAADTTLRSSPTCRATNAWTVLLPSKDRGAHRPRTRSPARAYPSRERMEEREGAETRSRAARPLPRDRCGS